MFMMLILISALCYRGKGGGWATWGVIPKGKNNLAHGFSALLMGCTAGLLTHWVYAPLYAILYFLFTKPDIGTGFATIDNDDVLFKHDITQGRFDPWLTLADWTSVKFIKYGIRAAGTVWMTFRQLYILPFMALGYYLGEGSIWALSGCLLFGVIYYLAGRIAKATSLDAVELAEWATGTLIAIIFYGVVCG